jgi:hypothetical protein
MRALLNKGLSDLDLLLEIIQFLEFEGVQPAPEPKPLPEVNRSEIRLIAWMAVAKSQPAKVGAGA